MADVGHGKPQLPALFPFRRYRDDIVTRAAHKWLQRRGFHVWKWPERTPQERNKIRVLAGRCSMDSPAWANGVRINAEQDDGWLRVEVEADESVKGWALSFNGRDVPIYVERPSGQSAPWPGESEGFEHDLAEVEVGLNLMYAAADDELLGSLRGECVAALQRLRLRLRGQESSDV